ncbi:MAG: helix-turn-helix domain-containing protein [Armatimonadetes bacterium]|nr:helix-turn-helix domain-containing protein [Armatimonadota bacterium]
MANYDNRLSDWFKQVEEREKQLKARKNPVEEPIREELAPIMEQPRPQPPVRMEPSAIESPREEVQTSAVLTATETRTFVTESIRPDDEGTSEPRAVAPVESGPAEVTRRDTGPAPVLFDDNDIPRVEDFFSFLSHTAEPREIERPYVPPAAEDPEPVMEEPPAVMEAPVPLSFGHLSEGTGEPRPIVTDRPVEETPPAHPAMIRPEPVRPVQPRPVEPQPVEQEQVPFDRVIHDPTEQPQGLQEKWDRMPHHLQTLFGASADEVAQNSYKAFRESRGDLIQRLLDPPISLEEAARILNVCPTTVRRYTNRGTLKHFRTAGNQRRFRLSDVLVFMESNTRKGSAAAQDEE